MRTEIAVEIEAPAELVWALYADVERWPEWTASVTRVVPVDGPDLAVGTRFAIKQPRMPRLVWEVTALDPNGSWTWVQRSPGGTTTAFHEVVPLGPGRTLVRSGVDQRGPVGLPVGVLMRRLTRRFLALEAEGLRARSEATHRRDGSPA